MLQGHVKSSLVGPGVVVPVSGGQAALPGNEVYVCEHRDVGGFGRGHNRQVRFLPHLTSPPHPTPPPQGGGLGRISLLSGDVWYYNPQIVATLLTADVTSSERKAINSGGQGLAAQLRKDAPAIADVRIGCVNVCVLDDDAALALAQKGVCYCVQQAWSRYGNKQTRPLLSYNVRPGCNAEELSRKYKEIMKIDSESTAAVTVKSSLLPVVDGKFIWEGDLDLFAIDCADGRKTVFDVHITVQGLTQ
jgi:hypothetical protein